MYKSVPYEGLLTLFKASLWTSGHGSSLSNCLTIDLSLAQAHWAGSCPTCSRGICSGIPQCCCLQIVPVDAQGRAQATPAAQDSAAAESLLQQAGSLEQPALNRPLTGDETTDDDEEPLPQDPTQAQGQPADHPADVAAATQQQRQQQSRLQNADARLNPGSQSAGVLHDVLGTPDTADNDSEWNPQLSGNHKGASGEAQAGNHLAIYPHVQYSPQFICCHGCFACRASWHTVFIYLIERK